MGRGARRPLVRDLPGAGHGSRSVAALMETKSIIFLILSGVVIPVGIVAVGRNPRWKDACACLLLFGTTEYSLRQINFFTREWYRGTTRGFEFCWLDFLWIFILVDEYRKRREGQRVQRPYALIAMGVFLAYNALNVALSDPKLFGLFELSKMLRGILVFVAMAHYVKSERELRLLVWALGVAVIYEWMATVHSRVILGHARAMGTLFHPNTLSMYSLISVPVLLAVALSDADARLRRLCGVASFLGTTSVLFTVSRAGLVSILVLVASVGMTCGSFRITARKAAVAAVVLLIGGGVFAKMWPSIQARFAEGTLEKEYGGEANEGRGSYLNLARITVDESVWGCGLNNWSWYVTNHYGPRIGFRYIPYTDPDVPPEPGRIRAGSNVDAPQAPPGHSLYAITLGETGWPGVMLCAVVWLRWLQMTGSFLFRRSSAFLSRFGVGTFFGLVGALAQSFSEWEIRQTPLLFLLHILLGAAAAAYPVRPSARPPSRPPRMAFP